MEYREFQAKTVDDAITKACTELSVASDRLSYEIISEGSGGFLGMGAKPAVIKAAIKEEVEKESEKPENTGLSEISGISEIKEHKDEKINWDHLKVKAEGFLQDVLKSIGIEAKLNIGVDEANRVLNIDMSGEEMGILIGKRGQTLDSLQYLISLVVNQDATTYIHVKLDTENYRERRKATLENLAKNIGVKVKRTRRTCILEPMNPYERRIIHYALQNDKYVTTYSEGEEPYRKVVVALKK